MHLLKSKKNPVNIMCASIERLRCDHGIQFYKAFPLFRQLGVKNVDCNTMSLDCPGV